MPDELPPPFSVSNLFSVRQSACSWLGMLIVVKSVRSVSDMICSGFWSH